MNSLQPDRGRAKLACTKEEVHSDQYKQGQTKINLNFINMKTKTIQFFFAMIFIATSSLFLTGCQQEEININQPSISEDVSKVSLQRLVEMHHDQTVPQELYDDIEKRTASLSDQEYDHYMELWAKDEVNSSIKLNVISENSRQDNEKKLLLHLQARNKKAKEMYGKSMNKLSDNEQESVLKAVMSSPQANSSNGLLAKASGCSKYYYGYVTTNNGSGLTSCSGYMSATNSVDNDCDYEFIFYPGPITYNSTNLRTKGTSADANAILNQGGVNGRIEGSSFRILVGYWRILKKYPSIAISGPSAFASEIKFRGLA